VIASGRALFGTLREVRGGTERRPVAIDGARELVPLLARELREGGDASAVREGGSSGAAVLVWIGKADEDALRAASLAHVPIVGMTDGESLPYVLDTDLVVVRPGEGLPVAGVARAIASALGDRGAGLAARLPVLTLNQARLVLRIGQAYGREVDQSRLPELLGVVGAGFGLRTVARELLDFVPFAGWAAKGAVAYAGTRAIGEAARRYFASALTIS
jgi:uncharacterized protein (DUF697 family)